MKNMLNRFIFHKLILKKILKFLYKEIIAGEESFKIGTELDDTILQKIIQAKEKFLEQYLSFSFMITSAKQEQFLKIILTKLSP